MLPPDVGSDWVGLTAEPLPVDALTAWVTTPGSGAVVVFLGVVRDHAQGRDNVTALTYEAYEQPAVTKLLDVVRAARERWPVVDRVAAVHRTGHVELSEPSVVVAVSSPHRSEAFEAARYCIDTIKESVPIWKQEHWSEGSGWGTDASALRPVGGER